MIRQEMSVEPYLAAYLVPSAWARVSIPEVRRRLARRLPGYSIPARFTVLDRLPEGANGKVDRKALPAPSAVSLTPDEGHIPPRDGLERRLAELWEDLLQVRPIGVTDDFFDLGGDSLIAAALTTGLEELTPKRLPPATLIDYSTIAKLAAIIRADHAPSSEVLVPFQTAGTAAPCFFVHQHNGSVRGYGALANCLGPEQPFYGIQSPSDQPPFASIPAMAAHYLAALRKFHPRGPYHLGGLCFGGVVAFEMAQQLYAVGETVGSLCIVLVTPEDFPGLISPALRRRFRRYRLQQQIAAELQEARHRPSWKRVPYLMRAAVRTVWERGRILAARSLLQRDRRLPPQLREQTLIHDAQFAGYRPVSYPGRMTVILRADHAPLYRGDPAHDWKDVARGGARIHLVSSIDGALWRRPVVEAIAEHLRAELQLADPRI